MLSVFRDFLARRFDLYYCFQLILISVSWALLGMRGKTARQKARSFLLDAAVLFLLSFLANVLLYPLGGGFLSAWSLVLGVMSAAYLFLQSRYYLQTKLALWCSMYAGMLSIMAVAGQLSMLSGYVGIVGEAQGVLRNIVYCLFLPLAWFLRKMGSNNFENIPPIGMVQTVVGCVGLLVMQAAESGSSRIQVNGDPGRLTLIFLIAYLCLFVDVVASIYALYAISREHGKVLELQVARQRLEQEQELAEITQRRLDDLHTIRHDIKNQYGYMGILLQEKRYGELETYFREMTQVPIPALSFLDCGNQVMNTILNMELDKAQKAGLQVERQLVVPPVLPFRDDDLCSLVANLMDNAIEETARLGGGTITLAIYPQKDYLYLCVTNPTDQTHLVRGGLGLVTTKADKLLHGYGTRIIRRIAEKYNGMVDYSIDSGTFTAKVLLDIMCKEERSRD